MRNKVIVTVHGKPDPDRLKAAVERYCRRVMFEGGRTNEKEISTTKSTKNSRSNNNDPIVIIEYAQ